MNKRFFNALLLGAVVLSTGTFISCNDDDIDDLKSRVSVVETAVGELEAELATALKTGASIVKVEENNGTYTLTLSDNQKIVIQPGGGNISITVTDTEAIITVNGTKYTLPLGSKVNSLIYSPETVEGVVEIGNAGATVKFLPRPALTSIEGAEFTIAESHMLTRAADGEQFKVNGAAELKDGFIVVSIKALGEAEAGKTYAVSLQMKFGGTVIGSNYFNVRVSDDFSAVAEDLGGVTIKADYAPKDLADGFKEMTVNGLDLLTDLNFKNLFSELPENAEFAVASSSKQPDGKAQEKQGMLSKSLGSDGTWKFIERPGTSFNENADRPGFLINVLADDVVKAKIYVIVVDPLADVDFRGNLVGKFGAHLEYGEPNPEGGEGEGIALAIGANKIDLSKILTAGTFSLMHDQGAFVEVFKNYSIKVGDEEILYNDGSKVVADAAALAKYAKLSRGLHWFNIQTSVASSQRRGFEMPESEADKIAKYGGVCNGEIIKGWDGISVDDMAALGIKITDDGFFETTEAYGGWALRVGMGFEFEYDYGMKAISEGCLAYIWFNRRKSAEGVIDIAVR